MIVVSSGHPFHGLNNRSEFKQANADRLFILYCPLCPHCLPLWTLPRSASESTNDDFLFPQNSIGSIRCQRAALLGNMPCPGKMGEDLIPVDDCARQSR